MEGPAGIVFSASFAGLVRTLDAGETWHPVGPTEESYLALLGHSDGMLYAGTYSRGVLRSADGGATWSASSDLGTVGSTVLSLVEGAGGSILAGTLGGVARSVDRGDTWQPILSLPYANALQADGDVILAGSRFGRSFRSEDGGQTWQSLDGAFPPLPGAFVDRFASDGRGGALAVIDNTVYRSDDRGRSWGRLPWTFTDRVADVAAETRGAIYLAAEDGIWVSEDAGATRHLVGYRPLPIGVVAESEAGTMAGASDLSLSGSMYWRDAGTGDWYPGGWLRDVAPRDILADNGRGLILALTSLEEAALGGAYRSDDAGRSWQLTGLHSKGVFSLVADGTAAIYAGTGPGQLGGTGDVLAGVYRSRDGGRTWSDVSGGLARSSSAMEVRQVAVDGAGNVYARTVDAGARPNLQRSDAGGHWAGILPDALRHDLRAFVVRADGVLFVGVGGDVHRSNDQGRVWTRVGSMPGGAAVTVMVDWNGVVWGGTESGLFTSEDDGVTWTREDELPPDAWITFLKPWDGGNLLLAGTGSHGGYRVERSGS